MNDILARDYYEQPNFWGKEPTTADEERIRTTISLIPKGVSSILDAGCGDGRLTNRLGREYREVVGMDNSEEALSYVAGTKIRGSLDAIPMDDNSFDLVICSEVLEHLPQDVYIKTRSEIQRVSKKYIIISVPNNEPIEQAFGRCYDCKCTYHIFRHLRSFNVEQLPEILENCDLRESVLCGPFGKDYNSLLLRVKRLLGSGWASSSTALCPQCGSRRLYESKRNVLTLFVGILNKIFSRGRRKGWIIALYEKRGLSKAY
jgi:SAM-dependent methyltransferase